MLILSDNEVDRAAWKIVIDGARSYQEDWIDEEGEFTEEDGDRVFNRAGELIKSLEDVLEDVIEDC